MTFLFSCDNATCAIPEAYRELFRGHEEKVTSTDGWEPGALNLAQGFAMKFRIPLVHADVTRLLVDFEQDDDARWSPISLTFPEATRTKLADRYHRPYRLMLNQRIAEDLRRHDVLLHLMIHTSPGLDGMIVVETPENAPLAEALAAAWRKRLIAAELDVKHLVAAQNSPLGASLCNTFTAEKYAQLRLSVSQSFFLEGRPWRWETLKKLLLESLATIAAEWPTPSARESLSIEPR
jgi:predicted N-formylglutamate amidohydrolase